MPGCLALLARFGAGTCGRAPASTDEEGELIRFGVALRRGGDSPSQRVGRGAGDGLFRFGASSGAGSANRLIPVLALDAPPQAGAKEDGAALSTLNSSRSSGVGDRSRALSPDVELGLPPANPRASRRGPLTGEASAAAAAASALPQGTSTAVTVSPAVGAVVPPAWMPRPARGAALLAGHAGEDREGALRRAAPHEDRDGGARRASSDARECVVPGCAPPPVVVTGSSAPLSGVLASRSRSQSPLCAVAAAGWKFPEVAGREGLAQTAAQLQAHARAQAQAQVPPLGGAPSTKPCAAPPHAPSASHGYAPSTYVRCAPGSPPPSSAAFGSYQLASSAMSAVAAAATSVAAAASAAAAAAASAAVGGAGADAWLWRSPSRVDLSADIASANARAQIVSRTLSHATSDASLDLEGLPEGLAALRPQQRTLVARAGAASSSTASLQSLPSLHRAMHGVSSSATLQAPAGFAEAGRDGPRACSGGVPLPSGAAPAAPPTAVPSWPAGPRPDPSPPLLDERVPFAAPGLAVRAVATRPVGKALPCPLGSGSPGAPDTPQGVSGAFRGAGSSAGSSASASPRASRLGPNDVEYVEFVLDTLELVGFVHVSLSPIRTRVDPALAQAAHLRRTQTGESAAVASAAATVSAAPATGTSLALCSTRASMGATEVDLPAAAVCA